MKRLVLAMALLASGGLLWALEDDDLAGWARELASEEQETREKAAKALEAAGEKARGVLESAAQSDDPEVAFQAKRLLRKLDAPRPAEEPQAPGRPRQGPAARRMAMRTVMLVDGERVEISEAADGTLHVKVTPKDGGEPREYDGDDREDFAKKHPEIAKKYGLDRPGGGFRFGWKAPPAPGDDDETDELLKQIEEMQKEMLKRQEEWLKKLQDPKAFEEWEKEFEKALEEHREPRPRQRGAGDRLGIAIAPVSAALRYQLDIPEGGVLVNDVAADSRGARLGLQQYDVLLSVNGRAVDDAAGVRDALAAVEGPATAEVIREGERVALKEKE